MTSSQTDRKRTFDSSAIPSGDDETRSDDVGPSRCKRRGFLRSTGVLAAAGLLAGCINDGSGGDDGADDGGEGGSVDDWLADTDNYDSVEDLTGQDSVAVEVGAEGNGGANAFAPAAIEISPGTTVTWRWVNGYHNVVAVDGQFDSGEPEQNATFEHTFDTPGTVLYCCKPHESMGMKGAVVVSGDGGESGNASSQAESR